MVSLSGNSRRPHLDKEKQGKTKKKQECMLDCNPAYPQHCPREKLRTPAPNVKNSRTKFEMKRLYMQRTPYSNKLKVLSPILILFSTFSVVTSRDFQNELEPSRSLFDTKYGTNDMPTSYDWIGESPDFDAEFGGEGDFGRKNLHLYAVTGHLFNRSLAEEVRKYDSKLITSGDSIQVHFPSSYTPGSQWLVYREDSILLQGVPLPVHEGSYHIYIMVKHGESPTGDTTTLPCLIDVLADEGSFDSRHNEFQAPGQMCSPYEPVTAATISFDVDPTSLEKMQRVFCVQSLSGFMNIPSDRIKFHSAADSSGKDRPFLSGPGNIAKIRTHRGDRDASGLLTLSWPLGCGSDMNGEIPGLERLENAAKDGSLARSVGHDIVEWQIVNRMPQMKRIQRMKRQSSGRRKGTQPHHAPARLTQEAWQENPNLWGMPGLESEETSFLTKNRGRSRVQLGMIKATPMPGMPVQATLLPAPLDRSNHFIPPSTPTILPPRAPTTEPPVANDPPMVLFGVPNVKVRVGAYVEYRMPQDAFFDKEEGNVRNLKLKVFDLKTNAEILNEGSWPLFDTEAQLLYGIPQEGIESSQDYLLEVTDSEGKSSTVAFTVIVDDEEKPEPNSHKFTFYFTETDEMAKMDDDAIFIAFARKLSVAMVKPEDGVPSLTMLKTATIKNGEQRYVSWFDTSFNDPRFCQRDDITEAAKLMAGPDAANGRNRPAREFSAKFKPDIKLKSIKIELLGPCLPPTTTKTTTKASTATPKVTPAVITEIPIIPSPPPKIPMTTDRTTPSITTMKSTAKVMTSLPDTQKATAPTLKPPTETITLGKAIPPLSVKFGSIVKFMLPDGIFMNDVTPESELRLKLVEWGDGLPPWVGLTPQTKAIYLMPTKFDYDQLDPFNTTHRIWKGGVVGVGKSGAESPRSQLEVFVKAENDERAMKTNHLFKIGISNYSIKNFTARDRIRLIQLLCDIFGDEDAASIHVYPLEAGSVVFSWSNSSLSDVTPCPFNDIAKLAKKLFLDGNEIDPEVKERFKANSFSVSTYNLVRTDACKFTISKSTEKTITEATTASPEIGAAGSSTSVILIAVVVICLVILVVIVAVKCRMGKTAREKEKEKQRQDAAAGREMTTSPKIKKGVPIIFQDEIAMGSNGNGNVTSSTPLMAESTSTPQYRGNGDSKTPVIAEDDDNIRVETRLTEGPTHYPMTPPTPIMSGRPPPPYVTPQ